MVDRSHGSRWRNHTVTHYGHGHIAHRHRSATVHRLEVQVGCNLRLKRSRLQNGSPWTNDIRLRNEVVVIGHTVVDHVEGHVNVSTLIIGLHGRTVSTVCVQLDPIQRRRIHRSTGNGQVRKGRGVQRRTITLNAEGER